MKRNRQKASTALLVLGLIFLALGLSTSNATYSWTAVLFIVISLVLGGRWLRPRRRK
jgi:hypothetical protein